MARPQLISVILLWQLNPFEPFSSFSSPETHACCIIKPSLLVLCSSYIHITVIMLFKMQIYVLNSWQGQGPPSQRRSIVLIANKLKWGVKKNFSPPSDRQLCISLTNFMPQKNNPWWLLPLLVTTNKSYSANTDQKPCHCRFCDEGWHVLSSIVRASNWS